MRRGNCDAVASVLGVLGMDAFAVALAVVLRDAWRAIPSPVRPEQDLGMGVLNGHSWGNDGHRGCE